MRETTEQTRLRMLIDGKLEQHAAPDAEADAIVATRQRLGPRPAGVEQLTASEMSGGLTRSGRAAIRAPGRLAYRTGRGHPGRGRGENEAATREATEARMA